jgi:hypothetical protein
MSFPAHPSSDSPYAPSRPPSSSTSIGASVRASRRLRPQSRENSRPQTAPVQPTLVSPTTVAAAAAAGGGKLTSREAAQHVEHREMTTTHAQVRKSSVIHPVTCPHDLRCMVLELSCVLVPGFNLPRSLLSFHFMATPVRLRTRRSALRCLCLFLLLRPLSHHSLVPLPGPFLLAMLARRAIRSLHSLRPFSLAPLAANLCRQAHRPR